MNNSYIKDFEENGFFILENIIEKKKISLLENDISELFKNYSLNNESIHETCIRLNKEDKTLLYDLYKMIPDLYYFTNISIDLLELSRNILPKGLISLQAQAVMFGLPNDERLKYDWHQESAYMVYDDTLHFQFPLFNKATLENGTMSVLKKSHNLGKLKYDSFQRTKDSLVNLKVRSIDKYINVYEEIPLTMNLGDVAIFHNNTIHRSNHNISEYVRFSGVVRVHSIQKIAEKELVTQKKSRIVPN